MDDGVVGRLASDRFHVTTTTGGAARVLAHMEDYLQTELPDLKVWLTSTTEQWAVIAVQGPKAREILAPLVEGIDISAAAMPHMSVREGRICGAPTRLFRVSFTGELGFEVNVPADFGPAIWDAILQAGKRSRADALRHRSDACAARREGLHHRRSGNRRHRHARRPRTRLGDRQGQARFRRETFLAPAGSRQIGAQAARRAPDCRPCDRARGRAPRSRAKRRPRRERLRSVTSHRPIGAQRSGARSPWRWSKAVARGWARLCTRRWRAAR